MIETLPIIDCQGCGACCRHMRSPPFHFVWNEAAGQYEPWFVDGVADDDSVADLARYRSAPLRARQIEYYGISDGRPDYSPCSWLNQETGQCRYHEFRPQVCRDFEIGCVECVSFRDEHKISESLPVVRNPQ